MKNWTQLRKELRDTFGKDGFKYFNDKNKYTRRIKIYGADKHRIRKYLQFRYPNLTIWEVKGNDWCRGYYSGICFNLDH